MTMHTNLKKKKKKKKKHFLISLLEGYKYKDMHFKMWLAHK